MDRLHPSERGHRALAKEFTALLEEQGLRFDPPDLELDGRRPTHLQNVRWMVLEGLLWIARRLADLRPVVTRRRTVCGPASAIE